MPAHPGSIVSLFLTGEGQTSPLGQDGKLGVAPLPQPVLPVAVTVNSRPVQVEYAGGALGLVAGVMQVNILLPSDISATCCARVIVRIGSAESLPTTISVLSP